MVTGYNINWETEFCTLLLERLENFRKSLVPAEVTEHDGYNRTAGTIFLTLSLEITTRLAGELRHLCLVPHLRVRNGEQCVRNTLIGLLQIEIKLALTFGSPVKLRRAVTEVRYETCRSYYRHELGVVFDVKLESTIILRDSEVGTVSYKHSGQILSLTVHPAADLPCICNRKHRKEHQH